MEALKIGDLIVKQPIVQGGMGIAISLSGLASAVANAGGIGMISAAGIGMGQPDYMKNFKGANIRALQQQIRRAKSLTNGAIGVNVMMALTDHEALIRTTIEEGADLVVMGAGLPLKIPAMLAEAGLTDFRTKLVVKVSSGKAAKLIFQSWASKYQRIPDAVVVEGPLAGGHLGFKKSELSQEPVPLHQLVRDTVSALRPFEEQFGREIPVIAGGGIYTGHDMYHIMQAGAKAVKLGTRFVTTHECDADLAFKQSYLTCADASGIDIIDSPVGLPGRVVKSPFVEQIQRGETKPFKCAWHCLSTCNFKEAPFCIAQVLYNASQGKMDEGFAFAGTNAWRATQIESVADVMAQLVSEYELEATQAPALV